jgi:hypothetical protein
MRSCSSTTGTPRHTHTRRTTRTTRRTSAHALISQFTHTYFARHRYNPINPYPDWYVQPDVEEAERRWKKPKALANPFW